MRLLQRAFRLVEAPLCNKGASLALLLARQAAAYTRWLRLGIRPADGRHQISSCAAVLRYWQWCPDLSQDAQNSQGWK
jgi:hypothetical protein